MWHIWHVNEAFMAAYYGKYSIYGRNFDYTRVTKLMYIATLLISVKFCPNVNSL